MIFEILTPGLECRSYLLGSEKTREALILEPLEDHVDAALARLAALDLRLALAVDSHTHADHLSGSRTLSDRTGARIAGSPRGSVHLPLGEGDVLTLGELSLSVWSTPGHTADSLTFVMDDRVFPADALLIGTTGRTDLPTGDAAQAWDSLARVMTLPDATRVFPGHDYSGKLESTIGEERRSNQRFQLGKDRFVELMSQPRSVKPKLIDQALAFNRRPL